MVFNDAYKGLLERNNVVQEQFFLSFFSGGEGPGEEGNGPMSHNSKHPKKNASCCTENFNSEACFKTAFSNSL